MERTETDHPIVGRKRAIAEIVCVSVRGGGGGGGGV
jgi:hypothetical protein